jgi:hypothetical protein
MQKAGLTSLALLVGLCISTVGSAQVFKCTDPVTGKTVFTDKACGTSGEREYVPLHEANGMKPPGASPYPSANRRPPSQNNAAFRTSSTYDPTRDGYERRRKSLEMQADSASSAANRAEAKRKLKALDEQYRTSQNIAGSTRQTYDRQSTQLRQGLDSSRSYQEQAEAKRKIADLNRQYGGGNPFGNERAGNAATKVNQAPTPPLSVPPSGPVSVSKCNDRGCWGYDGTRYNRARNRPDVFTTPSGKNCRMVKDRMQCN